MRLKSSFPFHYNHQSSPLRPEQTLRGRSLRVRCLRRRWRRRAMMTFPTTPRTCPWGGMVSVISFNLVICEVFHSTQNHDIYAYSHQANLSPTGCTSCMVSISPTTVRFVETSPTKDLRLSRDILQVDPSLNLSCSSLSDHLFQSGAMHMA